MRAGASKLQKVLRLMLLSATSAMPLCAMAADSDFAMLCEPVFEGLEASPLGAPLRITVANKGAGAQGAISISSENSQLRYPIQLPQGSTKSLVTYPTSNGWQALQISLVTDNGSVRQNYRPNEPGGANFVVLVTDTPGLLSFVRKDKDVKENQIYKDVYGTPGALPDRSIGYDSVETVILGEGSERLSEPEVAALKEYVMKGGVLVFIGGAAAPILSDPRWGDLLPVTDPRTTVQSGLKMRDILPSAPAEEVSLTVGTPHPTARTEAKAGTVPLVVSRGYGAGVVLFWAFNPFERPVSSWSGREALIRRTTVRNRATAIRSVAGISDTDPYSSYYGASGGPFGGSGMPGAGYGPENDPFSAKMPPASQVIWVMIGYLIVVVPLNLLILRKLGKGEWAWGTTPVISLIFAGIYFSFAGNLYSAQLSTASTGAVVCDPRSGSAVFQGRSQIFFPRGGSYDLKLSGIQTVRTPHEMYRMDGGLGSTSAAMNAMDVGEIVAPSMRVSNLSFHQFEYEQRFDAQGWVSSAVRVGPDPKKITGYVENGSPHTWLAATVYYGKYFVYFGDIQPGQRVALESAVPGLIQDSAPGSSTQESIRARLSRNGPMLYATLDGFRPGPQLGKDVPRYKQIHLVSSLSVGGAQ